MYRGIGATLPAGFRPLRDVPFMPIRHYHGVPFVRDAAGVENIHSINARVRDTGDIIFGFLKPDSAIASYTVSFNQIIPLG